MSFIRRTWFISFVIVNCGQICAGYLDKTTSDLISDEEYPVETHYITTYDGYILCLHRIPRGRYGQTNNKVALLQHGLLMSSADWVLFGPGQSLGYILADEGYDVWLSNSRGNYYSRNHTKYDPNRDAAFWKFSWNEIGEIDLPAIIDYILYRTRVDGIYYVGHSQGTTSFYVMASQRPSYNRKIKVQISLAPIAYMKHLTSPLLRILASWEEAIEVLMRLIGADEFMPGYGFLHLVTERICSGGIGPLLCENALFMLCGFSTREMNATRVPQIMHHTPAGAATRQVLHYAQEVVSGRFRKYDFGVFGNLREYGRRYPPVYDLGKITAPVFLFYSNNDWMAGVEDVKRLFEELNNSRGMLVVTEDSFNHLDFIYGTNAPKLVYRNIVSVLGTY